ncbi:MAG TPA: hypothetical protein VGO58_02285 [Chitinophagaceae bacterium]|jgi:hypothetical protein|nr:hypothetical protein [Chitinophagaceae bacterium]
MRKLLFSLSVLLLVNIVASAQAPAFFNYQGVARNSVGNALVNKTIKLRLSIHDGSALGPIVYSETRTLITNAFGLFNVQVGGAGATNVTGSIAGANWNSGTKWMQVEIDPEGGNTLKDIGTTQLTSVPYALFTTQSGDIVLPFVKSQNEESPLFKVTNTGNNANSLAFEGLSSSTNNNATAVRGIITSIAPGVFSAGVIGQNNGTGANGVGIYGTQNGTGYGVYGTAPGGAGVFGNSTSGMGVYGQSVTGPSVMGYQPNTGTSNAGYFQNFSTTNTAATLRVQTNGIGEGLGVNVTGLGKGGVFGISNPASGNTVIDASTNGLGRTAQFQNTNTANTAPNVSSLSNGAGDGMQSMMTGTGKSGVFNINNTTNNNTVLDVTTNGLGRTGYFQNTGAANTSNVMEITSNGMGKVGVVQNTNAANATIVLDVSTNGLGKVNSLQNTNAANTSNVLDVSTNGLGRTGYFQNTGAANTSNVLEVTSNGTGKVGVVQNTNASNTSNVLDVTTNGLGRGGLLQNTNAANNSNILEVTSNGIGHTSRFAITNTGNTNSALFATSNGSGSTIDIKNTGTGRGATFEIANASNAAAALLATTNGTNSSGYFVNTNAANSAPNLVSLSNGNGDGIQSVNTGLGRGGFFQVNNAASTADALSAVTNGTGASWAIRGTSSGTNGAGLFIQNNATNTANNLQSNQLGLGRAAFFNASNAANAANALEVNMAGLGRSAQFNLTNVANTSNALEVNTAGTGFAASFTNTNAVPKALHTVGAVQFSGIGEGINKVLTTDINGNAKWDNLSGAGGVSGSGTLNRVAKWTPDGNFVGNSQLFDNGTNVGVGTDIPTAKLFVNGNFVDSATTTGFAATFINNFDGAGDGIKIKLGRAKSVYSPPSPSSLISQAQMDKIKNLISCDFTSTQKITILGNIAADGILEDLKVIGGLAVSAGNYIIDFINTQLHLPIKLGPLTTPSVDFPKLVSPAIVIDVPLIPTFTIPGVTITNGFNIVPATQILPEFTAMPEIPNIDLTSIGIDPIDIGSVSFWGVPDLCLTDVPGSSPMNNSNEFIRFTDKNDAKMGAIRAVSVTDWATNYLNPSFMYKLYGALTSSKADKFHAQYHFKNELSVALKDYAALGVEYTSGNGDYAEWLERAETKELITPGDIVAVKGGKITKDLECAEQVMVVSHNPIVLGNIPKEGKNYAGNNVAFMGQVPVKVMGAVMTGDYIVGQFNTPGYGIAKHPNEMTIEDFKYAVGRSWVEDLNDGPKMVNTVVGVHNGDYLKILKNFESKFNDSESRLKTLESKVDALIQTQSPTSTKKGF